MMKLRLSWLYATTDGVPRRSLGVAIVVGSLLNLINQGDALFVGGRISWVKLALTYAVPYFVATYGAVTARMSGDGTDKAGPLALTGTDGDVYVPHGGRHTP